MKKVVTIQDIANELGLSRNTVGKVLNGHKVPEKHIILVLRKAVEMDIKIWALSLKTLLFSKTKESYYLLLTRSCIVTFCRINSWN